MIDLRPGDSRVTLQRMIDAGEFAQSVVTDPPYHLESIVKRFGKPGSAAAKFGKDGAFSRASTGFMSRSWDGADHLGRRIAQDPEFWRLVHDVMLPGAYIVAFSSSRTYGYMQIAMEVAGFITHPMLGWTFASGFPKAHNAARAIHKQLQVDGSFGGPRTAAHAGWIERGALRGDEGHEGCQRPWMDDPEAVDQNARQYLPGSPEAQQWDGWAYGGQALKPALEPIYVGQKPFSEKNGALNILKHGVGAINIDGCRVPMGDEYDPTKVQRQQSNRQTWEGGVASGFAADHEQQTYNSAGRHPANLLHDGSDEVIALFPNSKGRQGDVRGSELSRTGDENTVCYGEFGRVPAAKRGDTDGSAARFFNSFPHEGPLLHYPKAGKKDRAGSKHATVKPVALMRHLVRLVTPLGGTVLDPFAGSGTTGQAALDEGMTAVLCEAEHEYVRDIAARFNVDPGFACRLWQIGELL